MRIIHWTATAAAALGLAAGAANAALPSYSQLYVFGDSLSDVGNIYAQTGQTVPVSPPYDDGRFSNGPVYVEDVADGLGLGPVTPSVNGGNDYAYGAAQTGPTIAHEGVPIDLNAQLDQFQQQVPNPDSDALYTLWIGANDVNAFVSGFQDGELSIADAPQFIQQATSNVADVVQSLADGGLQNLAALDVPDLSLTPLAIAAANKTDDPQAALAQVKTLTGAFDDALDATLRSVAEKNGIDLTLGKAFERLDNIVANPDEFDLTNVTDPCWTGNFIDADSGTVCDNPDGHLFWDQLHPTGHGHRIVADIALDTLRANAEPVPEPGSAGLLLLGLIAVALLARRRRAATPPVQRRRTA